MSDADKILAIIACATQYKDLIGGPGEELADAILAIAAGDDT